MVKISFRRILVISYVLLLSIPNLAFSYDLNKIDSYTTVDYTNPFINPADIKAFTKDFGVSIKTDFGFGFSTTKLDSFRQIEQLVTDLEQDLNLNTAQQIAIGFNGLADAIADDIQFSIEGYVEGPLSLYYKFKDWGYLTMGQFTKAQTRIEILAESIRLNPITQTPETATYPYISHIENSQVYFNYSRPLINTKYADISVGFRTKFNKYKLYHEVLYVGLVSNDFDDTTDDISNYLDAKYPAANYDFIIAPLVKIPNFFNRNYSLKTQAPINFDVGIQAEFRYISVGMQIVDINKHNIAFASIGNNCGELLGYSRDSCFAARNSADKIELNRSLKIRPKSVLSADFYNFKRSLSVSLAVESVDRDSNNLKSQWAFISFKTEWKRVLIPLKIKLNYATNITNQGNLDAVNIQSVPLANKILGFSIGVFDTIEIFFNKSEELISNSVTKNIDDSQIPSVVSNLVKNGNSFSNNYYFGLKLELKY